MWAGGLRLVVSAGGGRAGGGDTGGSFAMATRCSALRANKKLFSRLTDFFSRSRGTRRPLSRPTFSTVQFTITTVHISAQDPGVVTPHLSVTLYLHTYFTPRLSALDRITNLHHARRRYHTIKSTSRALGLARVCGVVPARACGWGGFLGHAMR